jgi:hypothetical protein
LDQAERETRPSEGPGRARDQADRETRLTERPGRAKVWAKSEGLGQEREESLRG